MPSRLFVTASFNNVSFNAQVETARRGIPSLAEKYFFFSFVSDTINVVPIEQTSKNSLLLYEIFMGKIYFTGPVEFHGACRKKASG